MSGWREALPSLGQAEAIGPRPNARRSVMRFLMLMIPAVYQPGAEDNAVVRTGAPDPETVAKMMKLNEDLHAAGALIALDGLHPLSNGGRVSFKGGKPTELDGPF